MSTKPAHELFAQGGENYAKFRPDYPQEMFLQTVKYMGRDKLSEIPKGSVALDIACGGGEATKGLLPYFETIYGTDVSKSQISSAFQHEKIHYKVAPCNESGLPDSSVDLVLVAQALHWFDYAKFFAEVDRVLKPKGVLAVMGYPLNYFANEKATQVTKNFFDSVLDGYWHPRRQVLDNRYKDVLFPYDKTVEKHVFKCVKEMSIENYVNYIKTWSAVNTYLEKNGNLDILKDFEKELKEAFGKESDQSIQVIYDMILILCKK